MSKHSNIQSQNQQASYSHRNQPIVSPVVHSEHPHFVTPDNPQKEWIATYLDGQYYLTDPQSMSKLKNIEAQIQTQRNRLAKLEQENLSNNNSFLSYQQENADKHSNKSFCDTEFNQSRHINRQEKVKNQLEKQQEQYRQKLKNMQKQKLELKKNMKLIQKKDLQKQEQQFKNSPSRKRSSHKSKNQAVLVPEVSPSKKFSKKASEQEIKEKSYHKSRIQKSIKDSLLINEQIINQSPEKSVKVAEVQLPDMNVEKSLKAEIASPKEAQIEKSSKKEQEASIKGSQNDKSIKIVIAKPILNEAETSKQEEQSVKKQPQQSVQRELSPEKSVKLASVKLDIQKSVKVQSKSVRNPIEKSVKNSPSINEGKSEHKPSGHVSEIPILQSPNKSQKSQLLEVQEPKNSERKSVKKSQKAQSVKVSQKVNLEIIQKASEKAPSKHSNKQASQKQAQINSPLPQASKSVKSPSIRASSKHSKLVEQKQKQKSAKVSEFRQPTQQKMESASVSIPQPEKSIRSQVNADNKEQNLNQIQKMSQKSAPRSNRVIEQQILKEEEAKSKKSHIINDTKSKKSSNLIEDEVKSKKSQLQHQDDEVPLQKQEIKSKKSQKLENHFEDVKSKKQSQIQSQFNQQERKSNKSSKLKSNLDEAISKKSQKINKDQQSLSKKSKSSAVRQQIVSQKSSNIADNKEALSEKSAKVQIDDVQSRKSSKDEILSKKSSKDSPQKSQQLQEQEEIKSIKKPEQKINQQSFVSEKHSFSKKSVAPAIEIKETSNSPKVVSEEKVDKSIQWSRVTSQNPNVNAIKFDPSHQSEKSSSFIINNNEVSMDQSSHFKLQMLNNELRPEVQEAAPQFNMKKKKEEIIDNQSEKKSKSFVIHSRQGSVKERSEKQYDKMSNSKISSPSRKSKGNSDYNESSVGGNQSITKEQIIKLHQQIVILQEKLKKVEERQDQMSKFQGTLSKIQHVQNQQIEHKEQQEAPLESSNIPEQPVLENLAEVSVALRVQPRLQIQSSILQVNTMQELKKNKEKESEHNEKAKLKEEIGRLKKIIRDMQIQKIKSIDHEGQVESPVLKQQGSRHFDGKQSRQMDRESKLEKQSINSYEGTSTQRRFGSNNKRLLEDAGKIIHNNSNYPDKPLQTPRRRSIQKLKFMSNDEDVVTDVIDLPNDSNNKKTKNKFYSQVRKNDLVGRIGDKERDFHNFIQSSRVIAEQNGNSKPDTNESLTAPLKNFSKITVVQDANLSKINYSRMVEQMKKNNPQEEQILPEIHMRDIKMPSLPESPNANMTQQQLLSLAKSTYLVFGINVDEEDKQLCVKKYKNCVIFTLNNQYHECILWHFSGKFYMGGWRTGEPGEGEKNGQGLQFIPDKHVYKGQFLNGKKNGTGILRLSNGNIYDGQWIEGVKNGRGVYLDAATRVIYSGEWRDGKKQGQGYLKLSEKEYYYGTFIKSIKQGFGVQVFVNGDKYKGEYKNGKFHGKGKYLWANGSCYEGQFTQGVRHGQGSWKSAKVNGDIYIGTYESDKKNGYGRYVWANGCMYEGGFSNDVKHGKGRLTYQDGKEIKGVWEEGNLMSTQNEKRPIEHEDQPLRRSVKIASFGYPTSAKRF